MAITEEKRIEARIEFSAAINRLIYHAMRDGRAEDAHDLMQAYFEVVRILGDEGTEES